MDLTLRDACPGDAARVLEIYAPIVRETAISFETTVPSIDELALRIASARERHAWIAAEASSGVLVGYAYATDFRGRAAYARTCESTVYTAASHRARGVGRALMTELLRVLQARGFTSVVAGISLPNDASLALHTALGFSPVGTFEAVGTKFGRSHDVSFLQKMI